MAPTINKTVYINQFDFTQITITGHKFTNNKLFLQYSVDGVANRLSFVIDNMKSKAMSTPEFNTLMRSLPVSYPKEYQVFLSVMEEHIITIVCKYIYDNNLLKKELPSFWKQKDEKSRRIVMESIWKPAFPPGGFNEKDNTTYDPTVWHSFMKNSANQFKEFAIRRDDGEPISHQDSGIQSMLEYVDMSCSFQMTSISISFKPSVTARCNVSICDTVIVPPVDVIVEMTPAEKAMRPSNLVSASASAPDTQKRKVSTTETTAETTKKVKA